MSRHNRDRRNEDPPARQDRLRSQRQCRTGQNPGSSWTILGSLKDLDGSLGGTTMFKGEVNQVRANARGMAKRDTYGAIVRPELGQLGQCANLNISR